MVETKAKIIRAFIILSAAGGLMAAVATLAACPRVLQQTKVRGFQSQPPTLTEGVAASGASGSILSVPGERRLAEGDSLPEVPSSAALARSGAVETHQEPVKPLWPLALYTCLAVLLPVPMFVLSYLLGEWHGASDRGKPYESGVESTGTARVRLSAHFFLVAIFLVVFDVESIFIFAWSVAARKLGWTGYFEILAFIALLFALIIYLWRERALEPGGLSAMPALRHPDRKRV